MGSNVKSAEIRESFLSFFESKDHLRVPSSSLIPIGDPTILLTIAGMNQFKPYFSGQSNPPNKRLTSSQKCFRTPDIDIVGDATHNTMFEMLGNFSIGDYFKRDAIQYAIEFLSEGLSLPFSEFHVTIHHSDNDAFALWEEAGVPAERIHRFGDEDNWWGPPIHGSEGPCGPCSELHYDHGSKRGCLMPSCTPNCENSMPTGEKCNRFVELWNLVFMQFYHSPSGDRQPLPAPSIDTGMGLERVTTILQEVPTMYETDLFLPLINQIQEISGISYGENLTSDYAMRAAVEHTRSSTFLTADGIIPGNEGRGYVLRRVIRRAIRLGRQLGLEQPFMGNISTSVIKMMGPSYPELLNHQDFILNVLELEEQRFQEAFENGITALEETIASKTRISGGTVFKLWDTYGFPVEMTKEIAEEQGIEVDIKGFEKEMNAQRERARSSSKFDGSYPEVHVYENMGISSTKFTGYHHTKDISVIVGIVNKKVSVSKATKGQKVEIVLQQTPFYPEGGGQVGDIGKLTSSNTLVEISDTKEVIPSVIVHYAEVTTGTISVGDRVTAQVDPTCRDDTTRNHTATHMLHAALREILGPHVRQAGSLVTPDRLRFDFSHFQPLTEEQLWDVQFLVNEKVRSNAHVLKSQDSYNDAVKKGALAFFGDKYDETVRLVEIGNGEPFSFEVCGGTHVARTGEVGSIFILAESSIGAGMRRIEAVSGRAAERMVWDRFNGYNRIAGIMKTSTGDMERKASSLMRELDDAHKEKQTLENRLSIESARPLLNNIVDCSGVPVLTAETEASSVDILRNTGDWLRNKIGSGVVALGSIINGNPSLIIMVTSDIVEKGIDASVIAKQAALNIKGGGGGQPESAQAGGREADKLGEALSMVPDVVSEALKG